MKARLARRGGELVLATAAGVGQLLFCESPLAGGLLLAGLAALAPRAAAMSALACALATLTARTRRYPPREWRRGLYGYAGALAGAFWGTLFAPGALSWLALAGAGVAAAPLTRAAHRWLTPRGIPALALPALVLTWAAWPLLPQGESQPVGVPAQVVGWALTLAGLVIGSRLGMLAALVGGLVGLGLAAATGASTAPMLANTVPTAMALGAVFVPLTPVTLSVATVAAVVAGIVWWVAAIGLPGPVPPLVAPFTITVIAVLALLRAPAVRRRLPGRPAPLPLVAVRRAEEARAAWRAQRRLETLASAAAKICVLTGAGVSTAAGLPDFRGPGGFWWRTRRITLDEFVGSPVVRQAYWREEEAFFSLVRGAAPTAVHRDLAEMHKRGRLSAVVTQNVDGLHQAAGLPDEAVIELHGSLREAICLDCGARVPRAGLSARIAASAGALYCPDCQGLLKSGSVMLGETVQPERLDAALAALLASDLLLVLGTSLLVVPASQLLHWAAAAGIPVAIVNAMPTPYDRGATVAVRAEVGAVLSAVLRALDGREGRVGLSDRGGWATRRTA